jgi:uncharacterized membrane protein YbhN (UPF0104 family)
MRKLDATALSRGLDSHLAKEWGRRLGTALCLLGLAFLALRLHSYSHVFSDSRINLAEWAGILALTVIYAASCQCLAYGWREALAALGAPIDLQVAVILHASTQIAKYVPGNVFHYAGRQALGLSFGLPSALLIKSTLLEIAFQCLSAFALSLVALPLVMPLTGGLAGAGALLAAALAGAGATILYGGHGLRSFLAYLCFASVMGVTFVLLLTLIGSPPENPLTIVGASVAAWLAGFLIPGAPAGLGVREAVLLLLLRNYPDQSALVIAVAVGRIVSTGGDAAWFLLGKLVRANGRTLNGPPRELDTLRRDADGHSLDDSLRRRVE